MNLILVKEVGLNLSYSLILSFPKGLVGSLKNAVFILNPFLVLINYKFIFFFLEVANNVRFGISF